ncbi:MAG: GNAT family N-acetyltransferase [Dehalococcoidia bacterium]
MDEHSIVSAMATDSTEDFARLALIAAPKYLPALYAGTHDKVHRSLFHHRDNMLGFTHTCFMKVDGKNAGMTVAYDWKANKKEQNKTTLLIIRSMGLRFFKQMRHMQWSAENLGRMDDGTYYVAVLGFYPEFRSRGLGMEMLKFTQEQALAAGADKIDLDAETYNKDAIRFYKRFGMQEAGEPKSTVINGEKFEFVRMSKKL